MDRRIRGDARVAEAFGSRAQSSHRPVATRGIAWRRDCHARWAIGCGSFARVRTGPPRLAAAGRLAHASALARLAEALDRDSADAPRTRLRRHLYRAFRPCAIVAVI